MIIDSSAIISILLMEKDAQFMADAIASATERKLSAANYVETSMVIESRKGAEGARELDAVLSYSHIDIVPVTREQADVAREAFRCYGKGRHPAGLNFGDCFAYALAKITGEPLLCKGADFGKTDIEVIA